MFKIGNNYYKGVIYGGYLSSYSDELTNDNTIGISGGFEVVNCKIGDFSDAYKILKEKIKNIDNLSIEMMTQIVYEVVWEYFGDISNVSDRLNYFPDLDNENILGIGKISDLKGKNAAACVERSALAHNLFKFLNVKATYKFSQIKIDGKDDVHAFNLIERDNKYYLFDSSLRKKSNNIMGPIFIEIPYEYYLQLISPYSKDAMKITYSLEVLFENMEKQREVIYSPDRENLLSFNLISKNVKK